jgi:hypothetical protein
MRIHILVLDELGIRENQHEEKQYELLLYLALPLALFFSRLLLIIHFCTDAHNSQKLCKGSNMISDIGFWRLREKSE